MTHKVCVIPARMASSRFPGKPMKPLLGMPMIEHIWRRCIQGNEFDAVIVATCDQEIFDHITILGGLAIMTADTHERCTDRVSEAIRYYHHPMRDDDLIVMVQGDEILINSELLATMVRVYLETKAPAVNLLSPITSIDDHQDVNVVKAVTDLQGRIVFLSRAAIPSHGRLKHDLMFQQTGVIAYSASFLDEFARLPQTPMEIIESVDMLRLIEHGLPLYSVKSDKETIGVDTPEELSKAEKMLITDPSTAHYMSVGQTQ